MCGRPETPGLGVLEVVVRPPACFFDCSRFTLERRQQLEEGGHDTGIQRTARLAAQERDSAVVRHGLVIRPIGHQRVEVVHDGQNARAQWNLRTLEPAGIALAVPPLVMAQNQRRYRIRERDGADDIRADFRMGADLLELLGRERTRLRQDVFGDGQLADVVQQRGGLDALRRRCRTSP